MRFFGAHRPLRRHFPIRPGKAETMPLTLVVDEFQEFDRTAPEVYGEVAGIWDELHKSSRVNLIFCGSVNRLMHKVFFSYAEPLYGRNTGRLDLKPFPASTFKEIFAECAATHRTDARSAAICH